MHTYDFAPLSMCSQTTNNAMLKHPLKEPRTPVHMQVSDVFFDIILPTAPQKALTQQLV